MIHPDDSYVLGRCTWIAGTMTDSSPITAFLEQFLSRHRRIVLAVFLCAFGLLALKLRFIQDDAFISFTYARSLVQGEGLAWSGTHVEGYTNFLWVLWVASGIKLGIDPVLWSYLSGIAALLCTIYGLYRLAYFLFRSRFHAFIALLLFGSNYTVLSFSTGGLETMLQTALICWSALILCENAFDKELTLKYSIITGVLFALAFLARMDSVLPLSVLFVFAAARSHRKGHSMAGFLWIAAVCVVVASLWMLWRYSYYGQFLPNTYYAKVSGPAYSNGMRFIGRFLHWYLFWPFIGLGGVMLAIRKHSLPHLLQLSIVILVAWCAYIVYIGGDFMEFRYFVPVAPFLVLVVVYCVWHGIGGYLFKRPRG